MFENTYISRPYYINKVRPYIDKPLIKVFIGQRRVGKSYVMRQISDEILSNNTQANIIFIDKERLEFSSLTDEQELNNYVKQHLAKNQKNYLFIDEVQEIQHFELCLRSLLNEGQCDIYCSGSNAYLLSGELSTYLSGRHIAIHVHALTFREYLQFNRLPSSHESLHEYLLRGGMPFLVNLPKEREITFEYLQNIYSTILLKDIVSRLSIRNIQFLESLVSYLADNVGATFSAKNISDFLKSQGMSISIPALQNYIKGLCDAFLIYRVSRAEVHGMKIFEIGEKFYFEDFGIRNALRNVNIRTDINKLMENAVFHELKARDYEVYVGKLWNKEVDFIAIKDQQKIYVQVAYLLSSDEVISREFGNLAAIKDNYPKYVVTMDDYFATSAYPGIIQIHLQDFLTKEAL